MFMLWPPNILAWNFAEELWETLKLFFVFFNQNIWFGYSKEPSQWDHSFESSQCDGSSEHLKHMDKMDKKIIAVLSNFFVA